MEEDFTVTTINETLIRKYAAGASEDNIHNLITLYDAQRRNMNRAEDLSRAYLAQVERLVKENAILRGDTASVPVPARNANVQPKPPTNAKPAPARTRTDASIDISL